MNENESTNYNNLWNVAKIVLRELFIILNACIRKQKRLKTNELRLCNWHAELAENDRMKAEHKFTFYATF